MAPFCYDECAYNYYVSDENSDCYCGKCLAGCVAVAMAQIMNYWRYPADDFDWCNMPNILSTYSSNYVQERNAIAELIADCGDKSEMNYCSNDCGSGTSISKAKKALKNDYGYSNDMILRHRWHTISWKNKIRNSLDNHQPIFYSGCTKLINGACHAFVCDGYKSDDYFHFNWGWNGSNDGDFYIKDDDGSPVIDYHKGQAAIFYIEPDGSSAYCCDDTKHISNTVDQNNPFNPNFPFITWYGIPSYYNYYTYMATNIPLASEIIYQDGEPYLKYNDIKAGTIIADDVTIPEKTIVTFSAYDEVILTNFETSGDGEFVAQTIPCPYFDNSKSIPYSIIEDNEVPDNLSDKISKISIYPNPFQDRFTLEINTDFGDNIQLQIIDMQGNILKTVNINLPDNESVFLTKISAQNFKPGLYILQLTSESNVETVKIIKQ
ncbi:MAG: C10 family peptidase [Bacteroidales bacterium]